MELDTADLRVLSAPIDRHLNSIMCPIGSVIRAVHFYATFHGSLPDECVKPFIVFNKAMKKCDGHTSCHGLNIMTHGNASHRKLICDRDTITADQVIIVYRCDAQRDIQFSKRICNDDGPQTIECPKSFTLRIHSVYYGYGLTTSCRDNSYTEGDCVRVSKKDNLISRCYGKEFCEVSRNPKKSRCNSKGPVGSDYLLVLYACQKEERACDGHNMTLKCDLDQMIQLRSVNHIWKTVPADASSDCSVHKDRPGHACRNTSVQRNSTFFATFTSHCEGNPSCSVTMRTENIIDNACPTSYPFLISYVEVLYYCSEKDTATPITTLLPWFEVSNGNPTLPMISTIYPTELSTFSTGNNINSPAPWVYILSVALLVVLIFSVVLNIIFCRRKFPSSSFQSRPSELRNASSLRESRDVERNDYATTVFQDVAAGGATYEECVGAKGCDMTQPEEPSSVRSNRLVLPENEYNDADEYHTISDMIPPRPVPSSESISQSATMSNKAEPHDDDDTLLTENLIYSCSSSETQSNDEINTILVENLVYSCEN